MRKWLAFLRRDAAIAASYRSDLVFGLVGGLMTLTVFYFLAKTFGDSTRLQPYGDYFSFALVGVAMAASLRSLQTAFSLKLREAQLDGSLEALLATPLSTLQVIGGMAAYPVLAGLARALTLLAVGALFFGAHLNLHLPAFAVALSLAWLTSAALGLLSASFVLIVKRGDPLSYALDVATYLLCGVVYPLDVLPPALRRLSDLLPATHALAALRASGLQGQGFPEIQSSLLALVAFAALLWPAAILALGAARRRVERTGTLNQS